MSTKKTGKKEDKFENCVKVARRKTIIKTSRMHTTKEVRKTARKMFQSNQTRKQ